MWQYRDLILNLTMAELKNRYQNTVLGFFWSILSPLLLSLVLVFVFRNIFRQEPDFAVNVVVAVVVWRFFAGGTTSALQSVVGKASLVTKVYLPRRVLVLSTALSQLISFVLEFIVLIPIIYILKGQLSWTIALFPLIHVLYFLMIYGGGLILAAFFVYFRDLNQIWEVLVNILFFCSPIFYPLSAVGPRLIDIYLLNPMTRYILIYREIMVQGQLPSLESILYLIGINIVAIVAGILIFNRLQRRFAEVI